MLNCKDMTHPQNCKRSSRLNIHEKIFPTCVLISHSCLNVKIEYGSHIPHPQHTVVVKNVLCPANLAKMVVYLAKLRSNNMVGVF
jgi:hypothetical protein